MNLEPFMPVVETIYDKKNKKRLEAAKLPIEEKIKRLVKLQKRANEIRKAVGRPEGKIWEFEGE